jgi:alanyl aminopeptidase
MPADMSTLRSIALLSCVSTVAFAQTPPRLRLPESARPTRATVELTVDPSQDHFTGVEDLELTVKEKLPLLWLNANDLKISRAEVKAGGKTVAATVVPVEKDFVGFKFAEALPPGPATLHVEWTGELSTKNSNGANKQKEGGDWYVFTQFEPIDARRVFPSFDEPGYKIPWKLSIVAPKALKAVANGAEEKVEDAGANRRFRFAETKPLPTYLVAFAVGPFEIVDAGKAASGVPVRIITPRGQAERARWAKESTAQILSQLETWFGTPYAFGKLDCIAVPHFGGAMENPGLVTFSSGLILQKPDEETVGGRRAYGDVATHELAHQWFGDLVTTAWWDDIWLNEAFATWMTPNILEVWQPTWNAVEDRVHSRNGALGNDEIVSARRIRQPIVSNDDIQNAFDGITYEKGASVIRMFELWVGKDKFRKGVQRYLREHAFGNGTATQFLAAISAEAGRDVSAPFSTFLEQAGAPIISFATTCDAGKPPVVHLQQKRYLPAGSTATPAQQAQSWSVPVCMRWSAGGKEGRTCTLLKKPAEDVTLADAPGCPDLLLPNDGAAGYYRSLLDGPALAKLFQDAKTLSTGERLAVVSDLSAMTRSGKLPYKQALELVPTLARDANRQVVEISIGLVSWLRDGELVPESGRAAFARFIREQWGARAQKLGWLPRKGDDDETKLLRHSVVPVVADEGEDPALAKEARKLAEKWLKDHKSVDPESVGGVLGVAAANGDRALFDRLHAAAKKEGDLHTRRRLLGAMAGFRNPAIVKDAMAIALTDEFDARETMGLIWGATGSPVTRKLAYEFVKAHFDKLVEKMPRDSAANFPWVAVSQCNEATRADVEKFFRPIASKYTGGPRELEQALEELKLCTTFKDLQAPSVAEFFARLGASGQR